MICENCINYHDGSYGSGRFCSNKCARSFSTKDKRKEINIKVSKKLSKPLISKTCICGNKFETNTNKKYCSIHCSSLYSQLGKPKKRGKERKKGSGGARSGGGKSSKA